MSKVALFAVLFTVAGVLVATTGDDKPKADDKAKPEETKTVPKESIYDTDADRTQPKAKGWTEDDRTTYDEIQECAKRGGLSNVFLVYANDFRWAISATAAAYNIYSTGNASTGSILMARDPKPFKKKDPFEKPKAEEKFDVWVVAYLGTGAGDRWSLKGVERTGTRIRVAYTDAIGMQGDLKPYLMWASLGPLDKGKYTVELYETKSKEVKLTRLVKVD